ncbi:hypothetical protein XENTR_v10011797 [Xenopus tropicalis]|nr:hypothetical protein XENTR_v10011797 [Xenopus tropicalis]
MEVTSRQVIQFTPFAERNGAGTMEARQILVWIGSKSGHMNPPQIQLKNRGNLHYQFASELHQMPIHLMKTKSPEAQVFLV